MTREQAEAYVWLYEMALKRIRDSYQYYPLTELKEEAQKVLDETESGKAS